MWPTSLSDNVWAKTWRSVPGEHLGEEHRMQKERLVRRRFFGMLSTSLVCVVRGDWARGEGGITEGPIMWGIASCHKAFGFYCMWNGGPWAEKWPGPLWFRRLMKTAVYCQEKVKDFEQTEQWIDIICMQFCYRFTHSGFTADVKPTGSSVSLLVWRSKFISIWSLLPLSSIFQCSLLTPSHLPVFQMKVLHRWIAHSGCAVLPT